MAIKKFSVLGGDGYNCFANAGDIKHLQDEITAPMMQHVIY